jgi:hypothetical protein
MAEVAPTFEVFRCDRRQMTLSRPGCAKLWESALRNRPEPYEGRFACLACPIGAANAGKPIIVTASATELLRMVCPRCRNPASRLIHSRLCISCYNRHREALAGKNAKGGRPLLCDKLHVQRVAVSDGRVERIVRQNNVVDAPEVMFLLAKSARAVMSFGRRRVTWDDAMTRPSRRARWSRQLEMAV